MSGLKKNLEEAMAKGQPLTGLTLRYTETLQHLLAGEKIVKIDVVIGGQGWPILRSISLANGYTVYLAGNNGAAYVTSAHARKQ